MDEATQKRIMKVVFAICILGGMGILYFSMDRIASYEKAKKTIEDELKPFFETHACIEVAGKPYRNLTNTSFELILANKDVPSCKCDPITEQLLCG